jgi:endonuclease/exonuclease/phosphatase family metal-dependent hydrolase
MMHLVSCNVLHREWADQYDSDFKLVLPEQQRMNLIAQKIVHRLLKTSNTVVGLEELSGDQLDAIAVEYYRRTNKNLIYESSVYTEEITQNEKSTYKFNNIKESTTFLIHTELPHELYGKGTWVEASGNDGKGWVAIGIGRLLMIAVHISYNAADRKKELEWLYWKVIKIALDNDFKTVVIMGDFNASYASVKNDLENSTADFYRPLADGTKLYHTAKCDKKFYNCFMGNEHTTRKFSKNEADQSIDHIIMCGKGTFVHGSSEELRGWHDEFNSHLTDHALVNALISIE